jgi:VCBS repeat-containing protein
MRADGAIPNKVAWNEYSSDGVGFGISRYSHAMCRLLGRYRIAAILLALALGLVSGGALAVDGFFIVNQPWVRPAQAGQATEAYMDLTSTAGATLVGATSAAAATAVIRAPDQQRGGPPSVALPAGTLVALAPGKYRITLRHLARTLKVGDRVALTLTIQAADGSHEDIPVDAEVRLHSPIDDELHAHKHGHT